MSTIATQYSPSTIARCSTILNNAGIATIDAKVLRAIANVVEPVAVAAPTVEPVVLTPMEQRIDKRTPAKKAHMATRKPSIGQMERVNDDHRVLGLREYASLRSFRACFATMLDASDYYYGV